MRKIKLFSGPLKGPLKLTFEHFIWVQSIRTNKIWISHIHYRFTDIDE